MNYIGLDVGYSRTKRSSGVASLANGELKVGRATQAWEERVKHIGDTDGEAFMVAMDAPLLPLPGWKPRPCEQLLIRGSFQRRCKPGLSHVPGTGRALREAGYETASQLSDLAQMADSATSPTLSRVWPDKNLIEAFPNAFLGVALPESVYQTMPRLKRGKKFDWLYDQWIQLGLFEKLSEPVEHGNKVCDACLANRDHEERAALVCLLLAMLVARNAYTAIGEPSGGYIFLPPKSIWADWALDTLAKQRGRFLEMEIWADGQKN